VCQVYDGWCVVIVTATPAEKSSGAVTEFSRLAWSRDFLMLKSELVDFVFECCEFRGQQGVCPVVSLVTVRVRFVKVTRWFFIFFLPRAPSSPLPFLHRCVCAWRVFIDFGSCIDVLRVLPTCTLCPADPPVEVTSVDVVPAVAADGIRATVHGDDVPMVTAGATAYGASMAAANVVMTPTVTAESTPAYESAVSSARRGQSDIPPCADHHTMTHGSVEDIPGPRTRGEVHMERLTAAEFPAHLVGGGPAVQRSQVTTFVARGGCGPAIDASFQASTSLTLLLSKTHHRHHHPFLHVSCFIAAASATRYIRNSLRHLLRAAVASKIVGQPLAEKYVDNETALNEFELRSCLYWYVAAFRVSLIKTVTITVIAVCVQLGRVGSSLAQRDGGQAFIPLKNSRTDRTRGDDTVMLRAGVRVTPCWHPRYVAASIMLLAARNLCLCLRQAVWQYVLFGI